MQISWKLLAVPVMRRFVQRLPLVNLNTGRSQIKSEKHPTVGSTLFVRALRFHYLSQLSQEERAQWMSWTLDSMISLNHL